MAELWIWWRCLTNILLLSYFDRIIGPNLILTCPENLIEDTSIDFTKQVKTLLDSADDGFFTHYFSPEFKTANWIFTIDSSWARGRAELVMISAITSEEEPDYSLYEKILSKFVENVKGHNDIFKGFYLNYGPKEEMEEIQKNYEILKQELQKTYKILSFKKIETEGKLITFSKIKETKIINLSNEIIQKLNVLTESKEKENCFIVFRTRGKAIKFDILPVNIEKVIRLAIIFEVEIQLPILNEIGKILAEFDKKTDLIFTSGLCQEGERCIYEVYIDTDMQTLNQIIENIYMISNIIAIEVKLIALEK